MNKKNYCNNIYEIFFLSNKKMQNNIKIFVNVLKENFETFLWSLKMKYFEFFLYLF